MLFWLAGCLDYGLGDPDQSVVEDVVVTERFVQVALPGLDVLFVVDSTGSMAEEQAGFAAAAEGFLGGLDTLGVDYQVGVTSMDPADAGALLGRPWIITPRTEAAAEALGAALAVGTDSPPPSTGLDAAAMALADADGLNRGFRRADAALHVIFVSDGDDGSGAWLGADPVAGFVALLDEQAAATGRAALASAVVGDVPSGCSGDGGTALPGTAYAAVVAATGGRTESICTTDYAGVVGALGDGGVEYPTRFTLQEVPVEDSVTVTVGGARATEGWSIDAAGPALVFDEAPAADSVIEVRYTLGAAR